MLLRSCAILPSPFKLLVKEDSKKVSEKHRHKTSGQLDIVKITSKLYNWNKMMNVVLMRCPRMN